MIVRTYQRRNRNIGSSLSVPVSDSYGEEETGSQEPLAFSSQDSSSWSQTLKSQLQASSKTQIGRSSWGPSAPPTSTLMETQESGEMMEHVDEANFALDGLRPGQPLRIQRASLVSLLSICSSMQQRRLLRTQG
eukprot:Gb_07893 [translate_table: standard]